MALFVLGDPHLSFSSDKPMDVFGARWENHASKIEENWRRVVKPCDTVVLAGDLSWAMFWKDALADLAFLHRLPGKKILLKGNHDYWWETAGKMRRLFAENQWDDFEILYNSAVVAEGAALCGSRGWNVDAQGEQDQKILQRERVRLELSLKAAPAEMEKIVFLHFPPVGEHPSVFLPLMKQYGVKRCYYGHLHGEKAQNTRPFSKEGILFTLVSADALDFCPLQILLPDAAFSGHPATENDQNGQKKASFWEKLFFHFKNKC